MSFFKGHPKVSVAVLASNKQSAGAIQHAKDFNILSLVFSKEQLNSGDLLLKLQQLDVDWIILAGFLLKIPSNLIQAFPEKILNVHPSLLPKYGGKGMYGKHVHQAVFENKELETGISIHLVDEVYDNGEILAQFKTDVSKAENPLIIEEQVRKLELEHLPKVIEEHILNQSYEV